MDRERFLKKMAESESLKFKQKNESQSRVSLDPDDASIHEIRHAKIWDRIPKSKEDWMQVMIDMIRHRAELGHMSDKDIESTINRARPILFTTKQAKIDPDLPDCYYWNEKRVVEWIENLGFPDVKKMFVANQITGRRLIQVDACALNQMGLKDLKRTMQVTKHIRTLLKIPAPNALRAVMRLVPLELYYRQKAYTGNKTDTLTFRSFCENLGLPYDIVRFNNCSLTEPDCIVQITPTYKPGDKAFSSEVVTSDGEGTSVISSEDSLKYNPTVEILVRQHPIRERVITSVLDRIIQLVLEEFALRQAQLQAQVEAEAERRKNHPLEYRVRDIFSKAYIELGIEVPELSQQRVEFVASVAEQLMNDILKTQDIIQDMDSFQRYMENSMDPQTMTMARDVAHEVLEDVSPIAALLALGQLELDALIREAPVLQDFVTDIVKKAEHVAKIHADPATFPKKHSKGSDRRRSSRSQKKATGSNPVNDALSETKVRLVQKVKRSYHFQRKRQTKTETEAFPQAHPLDDLENLEYMMNSSGSATSA